METLRKVKERQDRVSLPPPPTPTVLPWFPSLPGSSSGVSLEPQEGILQGNPHPRSWGYYGHR